ncbi:DNA-directed RNA polymerase subunit RPB2 [uncultured virus]|nr:DNA-directed RNA polymerase subunit RPB2 [uncultured virus]
MTDSFDKFTKFVRDRSNDDFTNYPDFRLLCRELGDIMVHYENIILKQITYIKDGKLSPLYPRIARRDARTYDRALHADVVIRKQQTGEKLIKEKDVFIGLIPIAIKSKHCWLSGLNNYGLSAMGENPKDYGGYFIVSGLEKIIFLDDSPKEAQLLPVDGSSTRLPDISHINRITDWYMYHLLVEKLGSEHICIANQPLST